MTRHFFLLISVALAFFFISGCQKKSPDIVRFSNIEVLPAESPHSRPRESLRFAVAAVNSPIATLGLYNDMFKYMGKELGMPVEFIQRKTYSEINQLLRSGEIDLAIICSGAYAAAKEEFNLEGIAIPLINGEPYYYSYVIVKIDSGIDTFSKLKGKTYAFTDPLSNSGRLVPLYKLALMNQTPENFFSRYIFTYSHDNSIKAVSEELVDGASVDSLVFDYLANIGSWDTSNLKIIDKSPPYGINPVVVSPYLAPSMKLRLKELFLNMHNSASGQDTLKKLNFDKFIPFREELYDAVRQMRSVILSRTGGG